jgi:hypothetical protein
MIPTEESGRGGMHVAGWVLRKYTLGGEQPQHAVKRVGVRAGTARQFSCRDRLVVEHIRDTKFSDDVQAAGDGVRVY